MLSQTMGIIADDAWLYILDDILNFGKEENPRNLETLELINYSSIAINMKKPVVTNHSRNLSYKFMTAEAWWILSGKNTVKDIEQYSKKIKEFSDDGIYYFGAYGPKIVDQITYIVDTLYKNPNSRQGVMTIWRENPRETRDVPCTVSIQWLIRNNKLHCIDNMRSSDIWLGWPYDVFNFSCLSVYILLLLLERYGYSSHHLSLGNLYLNAGSQHLYLSNKEKAIECLCETDYIEYEPINIYSFINPDDFINHLKNLADNKEVTNSWLKEFFNASY